MGAAVLMGIGVLGAAVGQAGSGAEAIMAGRARPYAYRPYYAPVYHPLWGYGPAYW